MNNFFETLAVRGAGLAPRGDIVPLTPRPRARFEPPVELDRGESSWESEPAEAAPSVPPPAPPMTPPHAVPSVPPALDGPADTQPRQAVEAAPNVAPADPDLAPHQDLELAISPPGLRRDPEAAGPEPSSPTDMVVHPLRRPSPATEGDQAIEGDQEVDRTVSQPESTPDLTSPVVSRAVREQEGHAPVTVPASPMTPHEPGLQRSEPMSLNPLEPDDGPRSERQPDQERAQEPVREFDRAPMPNVTQPRGETVLEPAPSRSSNPPTPPASPVTVTIGRIEIEVAPPPPAPAPRPSPARTRGFDAYARARRGRLR